jgi:hypothetical protein
MLLTLPAAARMLSQVSAQPMQRQAATTRAAHRQRPPKHFTRDGKELSEARLLIMYIRFNL